jgi:uncharacterized paraquat-inducible protein A
MPVTIQCPVCDFIRDLPDTYSGTRVKCPKCRTSIPYQPPAKPEEEKPQHQRAPTWMVVLLVVLAVVAVIVLGGAALLSMRGGE